MRAEQLTGPVAEHGEGPVWWPGWGGLRWVDMLAGDVLALTPAGQVARRRVGRVAAALRPRAAGGMVVATEHDFVTLDEADPEGAAAPRVVATAPHDPLVRFNDGGCAPDGAFYCGTMAYAETPGAGTLFRLRPDGTVETVLRGVTISNGLAWTPDGTGAYYVDTATGRVDRFDYDTDRGLHGRRPFVTVPPAAGGPDGLTVDADAGVWTALWGGGAVHHYSADGKLDEVVELPVAKVTACTLGGPRLDELFITTSRHGETDPHPAAGAVFHTTVATPGVPALPFAG
jgi:sugar lactone lactonase YvrE